MEKIQAKSVDEYINQFPTDTQKKMQDVRELVKKIAPEATESMAYGMPAYKLSGKPLVYFAAFANHIGLYPLPDAIKAFEPELAKYKQGKGSIQFPLNESMPIELIKKIIQFRFKSIQSK